MPAVVSLVAGIHRASVPGRRMKSHVITDKFSFRLQATPNEITGQQSRDRPGARQVRSATRCNGTLPGLAGEIDGAVELHRDPKEVAEKAGGLEVS